MKIIYLFFFFILNINISIFANPQQDITAKITFIEIGSTHCIPCKKMKPILKSIENKYKSQIKVIFYDINVDKEIIKKYNVKLIPTQIFLNVKGEEIHRHQGFYPEKEIDKFLQKQGLKTKV